MMCEQNIFIARHLQLDSNYARVKILLNVCIRMHSKVQTINES